jgi:hypothetical protein
VKLEKFSAILLALVLGPLEAVVPAPQSRPGRRDLELRFPPKGRGSPFLAADSQHSTPGA